MQAFILQTILWVELIILKAAKLYNFQDNCHVHYTHEYSMKFLPIIVQDLSANINAICDQKKKKYCGLFFCEL